MNEKLLYLYCRAKVEAEVLRERLAVREVLTGEAGLSNLATTVILVAVAVGLVVAVVAILGPKIFDLAERTGEQIDTVPLEWGE
ncbi:MAG TPA: hypothetical protein EYP77_10990 [Anaerolineae bacterium]|nr:hypothetical protein [Anaerolineae bacterium]